MEVGKVERYVNDLMTVSGIEREGKEQNVGLALYHLLMSAALRDLMDDDDKELFKALAKKVQYFFCTRLNLKERKNEKRKESFPPNPLLKEKTKREKEEKTTPTAGDEISDVENGGKEPAEAPRLKGHTGLSATLHSRREAFKAELALRVKSYQPQMLNDFYFYWTEENPDTGKMRFEEQKHWNLANRLARWAKNQYSVADVAAAIRMKRLQKQQAKDTADAEQQRIAQERTDANDRLEQEIAERKKNAVSYKEWLASKEKNNGVGPQGASKL